MQGNGERPIAKFTDFTDFALFAKFARPEFGEIRKICNIRKIRSGLPSASTRLTELAELAPDTFGDGHGASEAGSIRDGLRAVKIARTTGGASRILSAPTIPWSPLESSRADPESSEKCDAMLNIPISEFSGYTDFTLFTEFAQPEFGKIRKIGNICKIRNGLPSVSTRHAESAEIAPDTFGDDHDTSEVGRNRDRLPSTFTHFRLPTQCVPWKS